MAVDVGNTQTVLGLFEGDEIRGQWRLATEAQRTSDELAVVFAGLLSLNGLQLGEANAMIVSSVVPGLTRSYKHLAEDVLGVPFYLVGPDMETGLKNRYDDPAAVGADRIVNAVAAGHHYGFPAIELLRYCQGVESALGRERKGEKAPRTIDVDVLLFGEAVIDEPDLEVPHRGITRPFNLEGLADLDSDLHIPGHGRVEVLLAAADRSGIREVRALC